jgi:hypothetical protein
VRENSLQSQTRLTPEQVTELLVGYQAGTSVNTLAKQFGIHRLTVSQIAKRAGIKPRWSPTTPAQHKHAAALYAEGHSLSQVAAKVGISAPAARAAVVTEGGTIRPKKEPQPHPGVAPPTKIPGLTCGNDRRVFSAGIGATPAPKRMATRPKAPPSMG